LQALPGTVVAIQGGSQHPFVAARLRRCHTDAVHRHASDGHFLGWIAAEFASGRA
jgi:hypothetical protein